MEYILISMLTIAVFTYIVSIVANKVLATPIHMKSLILCACCALLISLILPRMFMGFAGLSGTLAILIAFAMLSSYLIAYYYDNAMRKLTLKEDITSEMVFSEASQADEQEDLTFVVDLTTILNSPENTQFSKACTEDEEVVTEIATPALEEVAAIEEIVEETVEEIEIPVLEEVATIEEIAEEVVEDIGVPVLEEVTVIEDIFEETVEEIEIPILEEVATIEEIAEEVVEEIDVPVLEEVTVIEEIVEDTVEEIDVPVLEEVAAIEEIVEDTVEEIDIPVLEEVAAIEEIVEDTVKEIDVPVLEEVAAIGEIVEDTVEEIEFPALEEVAAIEEITEEVAEEIDVPVLKEVAAIEEIVEEVVGEIDVPVLEEVTAIEEIVEDTVEEIDVPALEEVTAIEEIVEDTVEEIEVPALKEVAAIEEITEEVVEEIDVPVLEEAAVIEDIPKDSYPISDELDDLMDFAFLQKEQRQFLVALETFRQALDLYPNSEVAPFLIVEIGTILKNLGSYDEAIEIFTKGRSLPSIINNSILEQEFINNIAYLRIVKNILVENSLELMPFSLIPESALKKIDDSFCEWRNQLSD